MTNTDFSNYSRFKNEVLPQQTSVAHPLDRNILLSVIARSSATKQSLQTDLDIPDCIP